MNLLDILAVIAVAAVAFSVFLLPWIEKTASLPSKERAAILAIARTLAPKFDKAGDWYSTNEQWRSLGMLEVANLNEQWKSLGMPEVANLLRSIQPEPVRKLSLIVCSLNRLAEPERLFRSLQQQTVRDFELIVVDQNDNDDLLNLCRRFPDLEIIHLRSDKGLSRARNVGLKHAQGDVIAFPDDDCWYPTGLVESVVWLFVARADLDGVTGRTLDAEGKESLTRYRREGLMLNSRNVWRCHHSSNALFFRRRLTDQVGQFNVELGTGAGTKWGSGEETEYLCRALASRFRILYKPTLIVHHPQVIASFDSEAMKRARPYAMGMGRVMREHASFWNFSRSLAWPAANVMRALVTAQPAKARYYMISLLSRLQGWMQSP